jgi:hypothetical protein
MRLRKALSPGRPPDPPRVSKLISREGNKMTRQKPRICLLTLLAVFGTPFVPSQTPMKLFAQKLEDGSGPTSLVITYRCPPGKRAALRELVSRTGLERFKKLKDSGVLLDYRILFSRYVDTDSWDMMAVLNFGRYSDVEKWKDIERVAPAGLPGEALALTTAINTNPVDLVRKDSLDSSPSNSGKSVFFVITYDYLVSAAEYVKYVDGYLIPELKGWMQEGVLATYSVCLGRYAAASKPWGSLLILEYKNDEAFGRREKVVAKVRDDLKDNPAWKALSENKRNIRVEKQAVIADEILTP